jgi:succinate dehydrogenase / fumarate reductase, cytochrome b subunit
MSEAAQALPAQSGSFIRTRLGSLLAVMPLSVWTVIHLWSNLAAFRGADAWQESVTGHSHPIAFFATSVIVLAPLLLHTVWGLSRMFVTRPNIQRYKFFSNTKFLLQRASALGVMGFLGAHTWLAMLHPRLVEGHPEPFAEIASEMHHNPPTLIVYTLGTLGVAYHLANGLSTFAMGWGLVGSQRALKKVEYLTYATFVVLLAMSWSVLYALWSAGTNLPH